MAQQIKKKFIKNDAIDGLKIKLLDGQSLRVEDSSGQEVELLKLGSEGEVLSKGQEIAFKSVVDSQVQQVQENLDAEETARISGDETLQSNIDSEESARIAGDQNLQSQIDNIISNVDPTALDSLSEIVSAFQEADSNLNNAITALGTGSASNLQAEIDRATAEEARIESKLDQEILDRQSGDSNLQSALDQEILDRQAGDTTLQSNLDSEVQTLNAKDTELEGKIDQEIVDRETAVSELKDIEDVLFEDDSSVYADASPGVKDPSGRSGWFYESAGSPDKVNWYFFDGSQETMTVSDFQNMYSVASVDSESSDTFHLAYYTKPLGDGNDAGSWYRTRKVFVPQEPFQRGVKALFYVGQEPSSDVHPNLPRVQMVESQVAGSSVGLNEGTEEFLTTVLGTSSTAAAGTVKIVVNKLGIESSVFSKEYSLEIRDDFSLSGIKQSLLDESTLREQGDLNLQANIDSEQSARVSQGETLQSNIDSEEAARIAKDSELETAISDEEARALAAEGVLQGNIDAEVSRATAAEGVLQSNIDSEEARALAAEGVLQSNIDSEESARISGDQTLQSNIDVEKARIDQELIDRAAADSNLQSQIDSIVSNTDPAALDSLSEIVSAFQEADSNLNDAISALGSGASSNLQAEIDRATAEEARIEGKLDQEIADRQSGDTTLQANIDQEVSDRQAADSVLQSNIDQEVSDRQTADTTLQSNIDQEISDRQSADNLLQAGLDQEISDRQSGDTTLQANLDQEIADRQADVIAERDRAVAVENQLQSDLDDLEARVTENESDISTLQSQVLTAESDIDSLEVRMTTAESDIDSLESGLASETSRAQSAEQALDSRVTVLEAKTFGKQKIVVDTELAFVDLEREVVANSLVVFVGRVGVHKDEDYSVSVVDGKTRLTWINSFAQGGDEAIAQSDAVFVTFYY